LEEARALVPELKQLIDKANAELDEHSNNRAFAKKKYKMAHDNLRDCGNGPTDELRLRREEFQSAIESLSYCHSRYEESFKFWFERISKFGVILRDFKTGLLDFPARQGDFEYFLCWKLDDENLSYWHPTTEGFVGRKPLAALSEYAL
jgi:hypothetical protein